MLELLARIIPLDFAASISPVVFALVLLLLGGKSPLKRTFWFLIGALVVGITVTLLGLTLGHVVTGKFGQTDFSSAIDIFIGGLLVALAFWTLLVKKKKHHLASTSEKSSLWRWLALGIVTGIFNWNGVFLNFVAAREVGVAEVGEIEKIAVLIINLLFYALPILLPLLLYLIFPGTAMRFLTKINYLMTKYSKYVVFILLIIVAIIIIDHGLRYLI
ncbi:GAP family protein [Patescibacteria group bacterium]